LGGKLQCMEFVRSENIT